VAEGPLPGTIGVVGAGTMGAGIAQLACLQAGARTLVHDPVPEALARGIEGIERQLERGVERERQPLRPFAVVLQKMERHALRRLGSDAGQAAQRLGQLLETAERLHESTKTEV